MSQIHMSQNPVSCPFANETKSSRLENYGFKASLLRFVQIHQICAENRPKSRGKIWKRRKKVVTLHCQSEDKRAVMMRDTKAVSGGPM